jgi:hypothetical protein
VVACRLSPAADWGRQTDRAQHQGCVVAQEEAGGEQCGRRWGVLTARLSAAWRDVPRVSSFNHSARTATGTPCQNGDSDPRLGPFVVERALRSRNSDAAWEAA